MKISANGVDFARWVPAAFSQIAHDGTIPIIELFPDALFCIAIDRGMMRGRDVLIHITMLPVTLAVAGTLIGLVWSIVRTGSS